MRLTYLFMLLILLIPNQVYSQQITLSGYVYCASSGERLIGANIYNPDRKRGTTSNSYGFYSFTLPQNDSTTLQISYTGYITKIIKVFSSENLIRDFELKPGQQLDEVQIIASEIPSEQMTEMSLINIPMNQIKSLPAIGGESDVMKAIQLMPGVQSGSEGSSGLYVRGGSPDQNLILFDDVPLYYINHLGGFVSIFNTDVIKSISLIKGGFPAHFGSRLSSVLDVRMKEGNTKETHGGLMLGLIASKAYIEGPIKKDTTSYIISYRRFLYDLLMRPFTKIANGTSVGYNFYDFNAKINHLINSKNRIYGSFYFGDDQIRSDFRDKLDKSRHLQKWGNLAGAIRWNHIFNQKLFSNFTLSYTRYRFLTEDKNESISDDYSSTHFNKFNSGITDLSLKADFDYNVATKYRIKVGLNSVYHTFKPGTTHYILTELNSLFVDTSYSNSKLNAWYHSFYQENIFQIGPRLKLNLGMRVAFYKLNSKTFHSIEPRVYANYTLKKTSSLKLSYAKMQQYVHLLTSLGSAMPVDLWVPATDKLPPTNSEQWAAGFIKSYKNGVFELTVEGYYKKMSDLITYKEGVSYLSNSNKWEDKVEKEGLGKSYGIEILLQKKLGTTTGWIGYSLSKTTRQFDNLNDGKPYAYRYDRRHDVSVVLNHKVDKNVDVSATWVYGTGNAFTMAIGKYNIIDYTYGGNTPVHVYEGINTHRMRSFHKLDVGINFHKKKKRGKRTWSLSVYNLYNRQNPYYYYYDNVIDYVQDGSETIAIDKTVIKQKSLFPFMPSFSYSFRF